MNQRSVRMVLVSVGSVTRVVHHLILLVLEPLGGFVIRGGNADFVKNHDGGRGSQARSAHLGSVPAHITWGSRRRILDHAVNRPPDLRCVGTSAVTVKPVCLGRGQSHGSGTCLSRKGRSRQIIPVFPPASVQAHVTRPRSRGHVVG